MSMCRCRLESIILISKEFQLIRINVTSETDRQRKRDNPFSIILIRNELRGIRFVLFKFVRIRNESPMSDLLLLTIIYIRK